MSLFQETFHLISFDGFLSFTNSTKFPATELAVQLPSCGVTWGLLNKIVTFIYILGWDRSDNKNDISIY